jgi:hypothetical protein
MGKARSAVEIIADVDDRLIDAAYLRGLEAGREETLATVKAWLMATPFAVCEMWGKYVDHMISKIRR